MVSSDQTEVVLAAIRGAPIIGSNLAVAMVRALVSLDRSSPAEEVDGGLKRINSHLPQETTATTSRMSGKKRRLAKESELVSSQKGTSSSSLTKKPSLDKVNKGKGKEDQSRKASGSLPTTLIFNESGLSFQLSPNYTPISIAKLLSNHVFKPSPNLTDRQMVSTICRVIESTEQSHSFTTQSKEDLFGASKRQVPLASFLTLSLAFGFSGHFLTCLLAFVAFGCPVGARK